MKENKKPSLSIYFPYSYIQCNQFNEYKIFYRPMTLQNTPPRGKILIDDISLYTLTPTHNFTTLPRL